MSKLVYIKITDVGGSVSLTFDLYANGVTLIGNNISIASLLAGYTSTAPDDTTFVSVLGTTGCGDIDLYCLTTTSTTIAPTTTTTTTTCEECDTVQYSLIVSVMNNTIDVDLRVLDVEGSVDAWCTWVSEELVNQYGYGLQGTVCGTIEVGQILYIGDKCTLLPTGSYIYDPNFVVDTETLHTHFNVNVLEIVDGEIMSITPTDCEPGTTTTTTTSSTSSTTTTTTTICLCEYTELTIGAGGSYGVADTYGTYCTESGKRYNCQTFDLGGAATIYRVGILGGKPIGSPNITMECLILDTHQYGGRADNCGDVPPCPEVTADDFPFHVKATSLNTITFTEDNPDTAEWHYFCFDFLYDPATYGGVPPCIAFIFTVNGVNGNNSSNYVQFCTVNDGVYTDGHYCYKINDLEECAWGEPVVAYDLSCKICYDPTT